MSAQNGTTAVPAAHEEEITDVVGDDLPVIMTTAGGLDDLGETPTEQNDEDVVDVDVENEDASSHHHAPQLVEGDFFPTEAPDADLEAEMEKEEEEEGADEALTALVKGAMSSVPATPPSPSAERHSTGGAASGEDSRAVRRRRVQWADAVGGAEDNDDMGHHQQHRRSLIKHVTSFYMPQSAHRDHGTHGQAHPFGFGGSSADASLFPEPAAAAPAAAVAVFKERKNSNGHTYLFCRAQRVAPRFAEWKRRQAHPAHDVPFAPQPGVPDKAATTTTLFAALYPPTNTAVTPTSARSYVATMNIHDNLQMPFIRPDQLYDEPLTFA